MDIQGKRCRMKGFMSQRGGKEERRGGEGMNEVGQRAEEFICNTN